MEDRKLTFGKYKGQPIKLVTLQHIGYIMWCLSNIDWFRLNDEEQAVYDALAIAIIKDDIEMVFPREEMASHIKNKKALEKKDTPFYVIGDQIWPLNYENPVVKSVLHYRKPQRSMASCDLSDLARVMKKFDSFDELNSGYSEDDYEESLCYGDFFN